jgi:hypothetical protein
MGLATRANGTDLLSTMNGLYQAGGTIGALLLPTVADRYGRKWACAVVRTRASSLESQASLTVVACDCRNYIWRPADRKCQSRHVYRISILRRCISLHVAGSCTVVHQ